jgi:hypothetical protein
LALTPPGVFISKKLLKVLNDSVYFTQIPGTKGGGGREREIRNHGKAVKKGKTTPCPPPPSPPPSPPVRSKA